MARNTSKKRVLDQFIALLRIDIGDNHGNCTHKNSNKHIDGGGIVGTRKDGSLT